MRSKMITVALLATAAVSISGCKRAATGQVVAVVNGEEVSLSELNSELQNAPQGGDKNALRAAALQNLINRKLMVQQAHDRGIDKDPEFLQRQRRMNDELMISMLGNQVTKNVPVPSQSDIDQYVAAHPDMFASRTIYPADQIVFAQPENPARLKALEADHTLDAVAARLTQMGIQFARQKGQLDTAATPPELLAQIKRLPAGEPFVLAANGRVIVSVLGAPQVQPIAGDQARRIAAEAIRRQAVSDIAKKQVEQARASAKIEYQPGFAPADAKGAAAKK